jgi:hypothetical protein
MRDFRHAKAVARTLRAEFAGRGAKISISESLELVAKLFGVADWNTLAASIAKAAEKPPGAGAPEERGQPSGVADDWLLATLGDGAKRARGAPGDWLFATLGGGASAIGAPGPVKVSSILTAALHRSAVFAHERSHEYSTLEHLLLALLDDADARAVLDGCRSDVERLRRTLIRYLDHDLAVLVFEGDQAVKPTAGFHRVIQRAFIHAQATRRPEVNGAHVLVAMFSEQESHACFFLQEQGMTRQEAIVANGRHKGGQPAA